jgi:hypothetical protein
MTYYIKYNFLFNNVFYLLHIMNIYFFKTFEIKKDFMPFILFRNNYFPLYAYKYFNCLHALCLES